jgi:hypothetical protein
MATHNHEVLKLLAIDWLYQVKKCKWVACELKFGSYIYDVVGTDGARIYVVESKAQRGDFLRECNDPEDIKDKIKEYKALLKETGDTDYVDKIHKEKEKGIKFYDKSIFKLANECYIIAPQDMIMKEDLPEGWGLLDEEPMTVIPAPKRAVEQKWITRVIGEIGKKHTKGYLREIGVEFVGKKVVFPERYLLDDDREIKGE